MPSESHETVHRMRGTSLPASRTQLVRSSMLSEVPRHPNDSPRATRNNNGVRTMPRYEVRVSVVGDEPHDMHVVTVNAESATEAGVKARNIVARDLGEDYDPDRHKVLHVG